jgi:hypothetical protein
MTHDKATVQHLIDYVNEKWIEARDEQAKAEAQNMDLETGRKLAYGDVFRFAQDMLDGAT